MNSFPSVWYHGSPYGGMSSIADYDGNLMFLTDSRHVASEYTKPLVGSADKPPQSGNQKTLYQIGLLFDEKQIFDLRVPRCRDLFLSYARQSEGEIRKNDVMSVHAAHGSVLRGVFPSYGVIRMLEHFLLRDNFVAAIAAEGTQGASLAVFNPQRNLKIIAVYTLSEALMSKKMRIRYGDLKRLIERRLREADDSDAAGAKQPPEPKPFTPEPQENQIGDSIDSQIDRFLNEYETEAQNAKREGMDYRMMYHRMIREADENEDDPTTGDKKAAEDIDIESYANSVNRLIEGFENLIETKNAILRRATNHLLKSYDGAVKDMFEETMREQHGMVVGKSKNDVGNDFDVPAAERAGKPIPGEGGGGA